MHMLWAACLRLLEVDQPKFEFETQKNPATFWVTSERSTVTPQLHVPT